MIGNPLGLLALLSIPAIIAIHYFRQRFQPRTVAGLFLWADPDRDPSSGRRFHKIENRLSLWLELLLALFLSIYLLDLHWDETTHLEHHVVVLDSTASMGAKSGDVDIAENARAAVRKILDGAKSDSLVTLLADSSNPVVLCGPAASLTAARQSLNSWQPVERGQDNRAALALARELAGPDAALHYVTDRDPRSGKLGQVHWHAVGQNLGNAALITVERRPNSNTNAEEVLVVVAAWGDVTDSELWISGAGQSLVREKIVLKGSGVPQLMRYSIPQIEGEISIQLTDDALMIDNVVVLDVPAPRIVTYSLDPSLPPALADNLRRALAVIEHVEEVKENSADLFFSAEPRAVDAALISWHLSFGPFADAPAASEVVIELGPFLTERAHPLLNDVSFAGVIWPLPQGGGAAFRPLVSADDLILVGERILEAGRDYHFNIDFDGSNLGRSTAWPVLIYNIVETRRALLPGPSSHLVALGESNTVSLDARMSTKTLTLVDPDGDQRVINGRGLIEVGPLNKLGHYEIRSEGKSWAGWQVHFRDRHESDLRTATSGDFNSDGEHSVAAAESDVLLDPRLHFGLLLAGLLFFVANALVLKGGRSS